MDVQRTVDKMNAAARARREAEEVRKKSEERSLHFAGRLLRRSEAEKQMRRPATVGMASVAGGGKGARVAAAQAAAARSDKTRTAVPKLAVLAKAAKRAAPLKKAKKVSGAGTKRKRGELRRAA